MMKLGSGNKRYRESIFKVDEYKVELGDSREDLQKKLSKINFIVNQALEGEE